MLVLIGILAAVLLPVLSRVRDKAQTTTCQSNLHQIGLALELYVSDHNRFYPSLLAVQNRCTWADDVARYAKNNEIFTCPTAPDQDYQPGCPLGGDGDYLLDLPGLDQLHQVRIKSPARLILVLDGSHIGDFTQGSSGVGPMTPDRLANMGVDLRHNGGANALFADGHTKWLSEGELSDRSLWTLSGRS